MHIPWQDPPWPDLEYERPEGDEVFITDEEFEKLAPYPKAFSLMSAFKLQLGPGPHLIHTSPKLLAKHNLIPGWGRHKYTSAMLILIKVGYLGRIRDGGKGRGDRSAYTLYVPWPLVARTTPIEHAA